MFLSPSLRSESENYSGQLVAQTGTSVTALPDFLRYTGQPIRDPESGIATIERTAYPRFPKGFSPEELQAFYTPDVEEQLALSIQSGAISSPLLLRRFGAASPKNRVSLAAEELGKVVRTVFLLEWLGSNELRQEITATTNKVESYNGFAKWFSFGGDVLPINDPDEQQKRGHPDPG